MRYADLNLGGLRLRTLTGADAALLVEATSGESAAALWGPRPAGPYSLVDAEAALRSWDPVGGQVSYGVLRGARLVGAVGLMLDDDPGSAEVAYWVRPEDRRQGIAGRAVAALTEWAHRDGELSRLWLEIDPGNTASLRLAARAGYRAEGRLPRHCRTWVDDDPARDVWRDCLIFAHLGE